MTGDGVVLSVLAPLSGTVAALADVPDEVFAAGLIGPGIAIVPSTESLTTVVAPMRGTIVKVHPHAVALAAADAASSGGLLVHLGVDTVKLAGSGFTVFVSDGDPVAQGDRLITWDAGHAAAAGYAVISPVVLLGAPPETVSSLLRPGDRVTAGDPVLRWSVA